MPPAAAPVGKPVYSDAHDPPAPGPKILDLHIRQPGFFGVYLDEVADMYGRTHVCVRSVQPGSEAHKQCPQLVPGMYGACLYMGAARPLLQLLHQSAFSSLRLPPGMLQCTPFSAGQLGTGTPTPSLRCSKPGR